MTMCDNVAATWNNYDSLKNEIESNLKSRIYNDIKEIVDKAKLQGLSNHFISGLELGMSRVLGLEPKDLDPDAQSVLFDIQ